MHLGLHLFEEVAHRAIGGTENGGGSDGRKFGMKILQDCGDCEVLGGEDWLSFDFKQETSSRVLPFLIHLTRGYTTGPRMSISKQ